MGTTSKRIQKAMELRGLKQTDLVEKTGISKGALSLIFLEDIFLNKIIHF